MGKEDEPGPEGVCGVSERENCEASTRALETFGLK